MKDLDVVLIASAATTGCVLVIIQLARLWRAGMLHKTIREAISRDSPAVSGLLAGVEEQPRSSGASDDRTGFVLIALGLALLLFAALQNSEDMLRQVGGASVFPIFVGAALLLRHYLSGRRGGEA